VASAAEAKGAGVDSLERKAYFPTLIFQYVVENSADLNKVLLDLAYGEREQGIAANKPTAAEVGSWRSATNLHKSSGYEPLLAEIDAALSRMSEQLRYAKDHVLKVTSMWCVITPPGYGCRAQCHPGSLWSGCYYLQAPEGAGSVKFIDPRTTIIMNPPKYESKTKKARECLTKVDVKPVSGQMVIYPASLYHERDINLSKEEGYAGDRAFVGFNISQVKKSA
jgi:uncharacterized protein (TIGR02466 family)